jgi:hypothetical protein
MKKGIEELGDLQKTACSSRPEVRRYLARLSAQYGIVEPTLRSYAATKEGRELGFYNYNMHTIFYLRGQTAVETEKTILHEFCHSLYNSLGYIDESHGEAFHMTLAQILTANLKG